MPEFLKSDISLQQNRKNMNGFLMKREKAIVKNQIFLHSYKKGDTIISKRILKMVIPSIEIGILGKKVRRMSLEAIEKVTAMESKMQQRKAAAEAEARQVVADAEREGLALLQKVRADAVERSRELLKQAEERAAEQAAEIRRGAEQESAALQEAAAKNLESAAEFIVGRVVKY